DRFYLPDGNIKFKLDNGEVYNVHRYFFEAHSSKFAAEYLCNSLADVVKLPGVASLDFECFLSLIYPSSLGKCDIATPEEWTSVLRLADKWSFADLKVFALEGLESASPVDRIIVARESDLPDWLLPAYRDLCFTPEPLVLEDAERLGFPAFVALNQNKEKSRRDHG
ncbi:hypothetical protein HDZ31DRAFT_7079, partial [Schizophyllum fasciatum]